MSPGLKRTSFRTISVILGSGGAEIEEIDTHNKTAATGDFSSFITIFPSNSDSIIFDYEEKTNYVTVEFTISYILKGKSGEIHSSVTL